MFTSCWNFNFLILISESLIDNSSCRTFKGKFWNSSDWNSSSLGEKLFKLAKLTTDSLDEAKDFLESFRSFWLSLLSEKSDEKLK